MSGKHFRKYFQKYYIFFCFATILLLFYGCITSKVPEGKYLLTKNEFQYTDNTKYSGSIPDYVVQKPNGKSFFFVPLGLIFYNMSNSKYDTILNKYMTYPANMRNGKLRDSLSIKAGHPEYVGKSMLFSRISHNLGKAPVILDPAKTQQSANAIKNYLIYRGFWDAEVNYQIKTNDASKKGQNKFIITHNEPTRILGFAQIIPYPEIQNIYERHRNKILIKEGHRLDQKVLEREVKRVNELMKDEGFYDFNRTNEEIFFTADTLNSSKNVPLVMAIMKDTLGTSYKKHTIGNIEIYIKDKVTDSTHIDDKIGSVAVRKVNNAFKSKALWRAVTVNSGDLYNQKQIDLTKRNLLALNNFSIVNTNPLTRRSNTAPNDTILDLRYTLIPLNKYEIKAATDVHYSQILNFGFSPSVEFTSRNIFGGAENFGINLSGIIGSTGEQKNKFFNAYELSGELSLSFPRFILPFSTDKLIPRRFSPSSSITLGASVQNNIGMGRINFNGGINYFLNVNDVVSHRFTVLNSQLSLTRNKDNYYDLFPSDRSVRDHVFSLYQTVNPALLARFYAGDITSDVVSKAIMDDTSFRSGLSTYEQGNMNLFMQSLLNKDIQTQDVLITSFNYNFLYNEIGKADFKHPFYFNAKVELAGNTLSLLHNVFKNRKVEAGIIENKTARSLFHIPYSQFAKFDLDTRKYFNFNKDHSLVLRLFIGLGLPYGNSTSMPFMRSYYNGGSSDIRAWRAFSGLGPGDSQLDEGVRSYMMANLKLVSNIEYRFVMNKMFHGALFTDVGNIWNLRNGNNNEETEFKFNKFYKQLGIGSGFGLRINIAYVTFRFDLAYKIYDPNRHEGERWRISKLKPFEPVINFAIGYPF